MAPADHIAAPIGRPTLEIDGLRIEIRSTSAMSRASSTM